MSFSVTGTSNSYTNPIGFLGKWQDINVLYSRKFCALVRAISKFIRGGWGVQGFKKKLSNYLSY